MGRMEEKVKIYIRTYPRSGTHLLSTLIHYRYGFSQMTPTFVKPIEHGKENLEMYTAHYDEDEGWGINGRIYVLRNPADCISSQYYRRFKPEVGKMDKEKFDTNEIPFSHDHSPGFIPSVWNEVGAYNEMLQSIQPYDLVLYFEDLIHNPEKVIKLLDSYFLIRFGINVIEEPKSLEEIKEISYGYYNKEHRSLNILGEHDKKNYQYVKDTIKPYIEKFIDKENKYLLYYA